MTTIAPTRIPKRQQRMMHNWIELLETGGPEAEAVLGGSTSQALVTLADEKAELERLIGNAQAIAQAKLGAAQIRENIAQLDKKIEAIMCGPYNAASDHRAAELDSERRVLMAQLSKLGDITSQKTPATWRWEQRLAEINKMITQ